MIPLKSLIPLRSVPFITIALIIVNFIVFFHQLTLSPHAADAFIMTYGLVPAKFSLALAGSGRSGCFSPCWCSPRLSSGR